MTCAPSWPSRWPRNEPRTRSRTSSPRSRKRTCCRSPTSTRRRSTSSRRPRRKTRTRPANLPVPPDLKELAQREGLNLRGRPKLLSREAAEHYGPISSAEAGITPLSGGRKFAEEFFDSKKALYEPEELTDQGRTRYLARKIKDVPPHVPPLDEVRSDVKPRLQDDPGARTGRKKRLRAGRAIQENGHDQGTDRRRLPRLDDSSHLHDGNPESSPASSSFPKPRRTPRSLTSLMPAMRFETPFSVFRPARSPWLPTSRGRSFT